MKKIIFRIIIGIAWGCTICTLIGLVGAIMNDDTFFQITKQAYIKQVVCSIITGIGFSLPTIIYDTDKVSNGLKALIHMGTGLTIYFIAAFYAGWIPTENGIGLMIATIIFATVFAFAIWLGFYLYYKREAKKINQKIRDIQK